MKKITMICAAMISLALMIACKSDNSSDKGVWSFQLPGSKTGITGKKSNSILNTKWVIYGNERSKERAVYLFINQDGTVVVAYNGTDNEYGYVSEMDENCIIIKINAYKSRATKWEGSLLFIDRKNNYLYGSLDAYRSKDPRTRQAIEQIPMSDYKGQRIVNNTEPEILPMPTIKQTNTTPKPDTVFQFKKKSPNNTNGEESSVGGSAGVGGNIDSSSPNAYAMAGRSAVKLPTPTYDGNAQGRVVIKVWVDRQGNVTRAEFEPKGSTTTNASLLSHAKEAARKAKFNADENAPEEQKGSITYTFLMS